MKYKVGQKLTQNGRGDACTIAEYSEGFKFPYTLKFSEGSLAVFTEHEIDRWFTVVKDKPALRSLVIGPFESGEQMTAVRDRLLAMGEPCYRDYPYCDGAAEYNSLQYGQGKWCAAIHTPNISPTEFLETWAPLPDSSTLAEPPGDSWMCGCSLLMGHSCGKQDDVVPDRSAGVWGIRRDRHDELVAMVRSREEGYE